MNDEDLRDCFAMFAMLGLISTGTNWYPEEAWLLADSMVKTRNAEPQQEVGIVAAKPKRRTKSA
jgi:hypothetical protein